ncbi:MAG: DUF1501 domain-containing protein [Planctomycetota bacterium]
MNPWRVLSSDPGTRGPHHVPRAKSVIFLYMDGGPSQVDTFDHKPRLQREHGKPFGMKMEPTQFNNNGNTLASPWKFAQRGDSGQWISELLPHLGGCVDELAVIRSMSADFSEHTNANYFLHTGLGIQGRPSMGAWIAYGLGADSHELPAHVVLHGGLIPPGGLDCFGSSFLPATHQGSVFRARHNPVANIEPTEQSAALQRGKLALVQALDELGQERAPEAQMAAAIANQELAERMQAAVPELMRLEDESKATRSLYGLDDEFEFTRSYGAQCLAARRLVERGVRFVELTCPKMPRCDRWDQHSELRRDHGRNARAIDKPIAGLIRDLKARGLLDQTLLVWSGEFGRTPFAQGREGRDHNPFAFTSWLCGGGVKGGVAHGTSDEYGYKVVQDRVTVHDLHATILHLLGIDHKQLTYRFGGRDIRLTDVYGELVEPILSA